MAQWLRLDLQAQGVQVRSLAGELKFHRPGVQKHKTQNRDNIVTNSRLYLPDPGIEPQSPALQADALPSQPPGKLTCIISLRHFFFPVSIFWDFCIKQKIDTGKKMPKRNYACINITCTRVSLICRWLSGKESACQRRRHRFDP